MKTIRFYMDNGATYMGWQKVNLNDVFSSYASWLNSSAAHSVKIGETEYKANDKRKLFDDIKHKVLGISPWARNY